MFRMARLVSSYIDDRIRALYQLQIGYTLCPQPSQAPSYKFKEVEILI